MRHGNLFIAAAALVSAGVLGMFAVASLSPISPAQKPDPSSAAALGPLAAPTVAYGNPSIGSADAPLKVFFFGDYQCAPCARLNATLTRLNAEFPGKLRVVWKDMPDRAAHPQSVAAANASRCAADQGRFWEYHALLMAQEGTVAEANLVPYATQLGLDPQAFGDCVDAERNVPLVERDVVEGQRLGIAATPTLFVGGRRIVGAIDEEQLRSVIRAELATAGQPAP